MEKSLINSDIQDLQKINKRINNINNNLKSLKNNLNSSLLIDDNIYQEKEINNIANKLSNISESILTEIIPKLKNNIDSN